MKEISLQDSIFNLCQTYPEIKDILFGLGFKDIIKTGMIQTMGRIMTLSKGSKVKNIPIETIIKVFNKHDYHIKEQSSHE